MKFLGLGVPELLIILVVILLIFGPKNLPKLGSALGKSVKNLREGMNEAKEESAQAASEDEEEAEAQEADTKTSAKKTTADSEKQEKVN